jgi:hypothetical protein
MNTGQMVDILDWRWFDNVFSTHLKKAKKRGDNNDNRCHYQACTAKYFDIYVPQTQLCQADDSVLAIQTDYYHGLKSNLEDHRHIKLNLTDDQF